jgi:mannosyltransferase
MDRLFFRLDKRVSVAGILILALGVRLMGIVSRPIWYDEAFAVLFAEKGPAAMLQGTLAPDLSGAAADIHPLAYYTLLWGWMPIFGESLISARMFSILLGIGAVAMSYLLMRAMFNPRLAALGALGVALSPFLVHYSQEIRMYSLLALALVAATYAFWQGLHSNQLRWWVIFAFCAALAQYTQNLAAFYLVPLALTPLFLRRWDKVKMTILAGVGAIMLYLPWLVNIPAQFANIENGYWVARPSFSKIFTLFLVYVVNLPIRNDWLPLALSCTILIIFLATFQTIIAFRKRLPTARRGLWLAYLTFTPPAISFLVSQWIPVYLERSFLASGVMFWLWIAWALDATGLPRFMKSGISFAVIIAITMGLVSHVTYNGPPYGPYDQLDKSLKSRVQPGDVIVHSNKMTFLPALYFDPTLSQSFIADQPGSVHDTLAPITQQVLGITETPSIEIATNNAERVWYIIDQSAPDKTIDDLATQYPDLAWLNSHFKNYKREEWGAISLFLFSQK